MTPSISKTPETLFVTDDHGHEARRYAVAYFNREIINAPAPLSALDFISVSALECNSDSDARPYVSMILMIAKQMVFHAAKVVHT